MPLATDLPFCPFATFVSRKINIVTPKNDGGVDFSAYPRSALVGQEISFVNLTPGKLKSVLWDFGDGTTSSEKNPKHAYSEAGEKTVKLTVEGPCSKSSVSKNLNTSVLSAIPAFDYELCGYLHSFKIFQIFLATPEDLLAGNEAGYIEIEYPYEITELGPDGKHTQLILRFTGGGMPYKFDFSILNIMAGGILYYDPADLFALMAGVGADGSILDDTGEDYGDDGAVVLPEGKTAGKFDSGSNDIVFTLDPDAEPTGTTFVSATDSTGKRITVSVNVNTTGNSSLSSSMVVIDKDEEDTGGDGGVPHIRLLSVKKRYLSDAFKIPETEDYVFDPEEYPPVFEGNEIEIIPTMAEDEGMTWENAGFFEHFEEKKNCVYTLIFEIGTTISVTENTINGRPSYVKSKKEYDYSNGFRFIVPKGMHGSLYISVTHSWTDPETGIESAMGGSASCRLGAWRRMKWKDTETSKQEFKLLHPVVAGTDTSKTFTLYQTAKIPLPDTDFSEQYDYFKEQNLYQSVPANLYIPLMRPILYKTTGEIIKYDPSFQLKFIPGSSDIPGLYKGFWFPGAPCEKNGEADPNWIWTYDPQKSIVDETLTIFQRLYPSKPVCAKSEISFLPIFKHMTLTETVHVEDYYQDFAQNYEEYLSVQDSVEFDTDAKLPLLSEMQVSDGISFETSAFETKDGVNIADAVAFDLANCIQGSETALISDAISFEHFHGIRALFADFQGTEEELKAWIREEVGEWITVCFLPGIKCYQLVCFTFYEDWKKWKRITDMGLEY